MAALKVGEGSIVILQSFISIIGLHTSDSAPLIKKHSSLPNNPLNVDSAEAHLTVVAYSACKNNIYNY